MSSVGRERSMKCRRYMMRDDECQGGMVGGEPSGPPSSSSEGIIAESAN